MVERNHGWKLDVERGPGWIIVHLDREAQAEEMPELADWVWSVLRCHGGKRLIVELDDNTLLQSYLIGQLLRLSKRVGFAGGVLRLAGLSSQNVEVLRGCRLDQVFSIYPTPHGAIFASRITVPEKESEGEDAPAQKNRVRDCPEYHLT